MRHITTNSGGRFAIGALPLLAGLLMAAGCGGDKAPSKFDVSGAVTYRGAPVPLGYIIFTPDLAKGNDGPAIQMPVVNGRYKTLPGLGTIGGPHVAIISGYQITEKLEQPGGPGHRRTRKGKPLFLNVRMNVDLPRQTATHDFIVPEQEHTEQSHTEQGQPEQEHPEQGQ